MRGEAETLLTITYTHKERIHTRRTRVSVMLVVNKLIWVIDSWASYGISIRGDMSGVPESDLGRRGDSVGGRGEEIFFPSPSLSYV